MSSPFRTIDPAAGALPQHRTAIFYGADICRTLVCTGLAADVALYCDVDDPCALVDRITELAHDGRTPLHLLFASPALARRIGLPGRIVDSPSAE